MNINDPAGVSALLQQLRNSQAWQDTLQEEDSVPLHSCSFQQALPHLTRLSLDPHFVTAVSDMKIEQDALERQLWDERNAIVLKHESKVKVAVTKASLTGSDALSQYEAAAISDAFKKEMSKFDLDRVLPAWDGLLSKQQGMLSSLKCPSMYITNMAADLQRQQRVIQVLEGIVSGDSGS